MKMSKKVINKYILIPLGTLVALVIMSSITSCKTCKSSNNDYALPELNVDKSDLQGDEREVELIINPDPKKAIDLVDNRLQIKLEIAGNTPGNSALEYDSYDDSGNTITATVKGGEEETPSLRYFYNVRDKTILEPSDNPLVKKFIFRPGNETIARMRAIFQIVNSSGAPIGDSCEVTWKTKTVPVYKLEFEGLDTTATVGVTNKFTIKVKKEGGQIESVEAKKFSMVVETINGDAKIDGLAADKLNFVETDVKSGIIKKEITVTPGLRNSNFKLQLQYNNINIAKVEKINIKALTPTIFKLAVDNNKIEDGNTNLKITVTSEEDLIEADLESLALKVERLLQGSNVQIDGTSVDGIFTFKNAHKLTIDGIDKKKATRILKIVPGDDRKAKFKLTLLDKDGKAIIRSEQIVEWSVGAKLEDGFVEENNVMISEDPNLIILFDKTSIVTKKVEEASNALTATPVKIAEALVALQEARNALQEAKIVQAKIASDSPLRKIADVQVAEAETVYNVREREFKAKNVDLLAAKKAEIEKVIKADKSVDTIIATADINVALNELQKVLDVAQQVKDMHDSIGDASLKLGLNEVNALKNFAVEEFKAKVESLIAVQKAEIEQVIKVDKSINTIASSVDIIGTLSEFEKVVNSMEKVLAMRDAIRKKYPELQPNSGGFEKLRIVAIEEFKAKVESLIAVQKAKIEEVIKVDKSINTIAYAVDIVGALNGLEKIANPLKEALAIRDAIMKEYPELKPDLSEFDELRFLAKEEFKAKVGSLVAVQKAKIEEVIKVDKSVNTIASAVDIVGVLNEIEKIVRPIEAVLAICTAIERKYPSLKSDLNEFEKLRIVAKEEFKAKIENLIAVQEAEIEKVIKTDKSVNTIAGAIDIAGAQAELKKVFDAVQEGTNIYKGATDNGLQSSVLENKFSHIISGLYVVAIVEFIKKAKSIVYDDNKNKEAAGEAVLKAQQLRNFYNDNVAFFASADTIIRINEGIQAAIDAVKLYNDNITNNGRGNQIDVTSLSQLIRLN